MSTTQLLFGFEGRIPRSTWWLRSIIAGVAFLAVAIVLGLFALTPALVSIDDSPNDEVSPGAAVGIAIFSFGMLAAAVVVVWISFALGAKRLHDQGQSGWLQLISFIPFVGWIGSVVLFVMMGFIAGTPGPNRHGPQSGSLPGAAYQGPPIAAGGAWVNPPLPPVAPQPPARRPNELFQEGGEWRSYDTAGRLLRWDAAAQEWVPITPPPDPRRTPGL